MAKYEKISKKNQDPKQVERDAEGLAAFLSVKSQHFAVGTNVVMNWRRYEVNQYVHNSVILIDLEDGSAIRVDNPYFMRR